MQKFFIPRIHCCILQDLHVTVKESNKETVMRETENSQKAAFLVPGVVFLEKQCVWEVKAKPWNFPGGPGVKNLPFHAGDSGLISGQGTKIPHAEEQLNPCTKTTEPTCSGARMPHQREDLCHSEDPTLWNERSYVPQARPNAVKSKYVNF